MMMTYVVMLDSYCFVDWGVTYEIIIVATRKNFDATEDGISWFRVWRDRSPSTAANNSILLFSVDQWLSAHNNPFPIVNPNLDSPTRYEVPTDFCPVSS